jgi:RimJ/RimL family protein N-acetyltransferase
VSTRLETERLLLRRPTPDDAGVATEMLGDPEVMRFLGGRAVPSEYAGDVVAKWLRRWETNGFGPFIAVRRSDGRFVGRAGINLWDSRTWTWTTVAEAGQFAQPELGWALVRAEWGNGYATEAAGAVRQWARAERGVERLVSLISPDNVRSQGVARRLGASPGETVTLFDSGRAVVWSYPEPRSARAS